MNKEKIREFVVSRPEYVEPIILSLIAKRPGEFYTPLRGRICDQGGVASGEFSKVSYNIIFRVLSEILDNFDYNSTAVNITPKKCKLILQSYLNDKKILPDEYVDACNDVESICDLSTVDPEDLLLVEYGMSYWLEAKLSNKILINISMKRPSNLSEIQDIVTKISNQHISTEKADNPMDFIAEEDKRPLEEIEKEAELQKLNYLPTGISFLDEVLGGGLGKGESCLAVIPSGGGKTVLACQLAGQQLIMGKRVVIISTEQAINEFVSRIFSSVASIPFDLVKRKNKIIINQLPEEYRGAAKFAMDIFSQNNLHFFNWNGTGKTIPRDLESTIESINKTHDNPVDIVIFDWLGGGLDYTEYRHDPRHILNSSASKFTEIAGRCKFAGFLTTQTDSAGTDKEKYITSKNIAEAKGLHRLMTVAFGISAITKPEKDRTPGEDIFEEIQYFNCFKSRNNIAKYFNIKRNFGYMRFEKLNTIPSKNPTNKKNRIVKPFERT